MRILLQSDHYLKFWFPVCKINVWEFCIESQAVALEDTHPGNSPMLCSSYLKK